MGLAARSVCIGLFAAAAMVALAAPSTAQFSSHPPLELALETREDRIMPITGNAAIPWTVTYSCDVVFRSTPTPVVIAVDVRGPLEPWVRATSHPPSVMAMPSLEDCPLGETRSASGVLQVRFTREAPAYAPTDVPVRATMQVKDDTFEANATTTVVPDFYSVLSASADQAVLGLDAGDEGVVTLHVENFGNGNVLVTIHADGPVDEFAATFTNQTTLDSPFGDGANRTATDVEVRFRAPHETVYARDAVPFTFRLTAFSAQEPDVRGDTATLSVLVQVIGPLGQAEQALPSVGFAWFALGLAALLRRR